MVAKRDMEEADRAYKHGQLIQPIIWLSILIFRCFYMTFYGHGVYDVRQLIRVHAIVHDGESTTLCENVCCSVFKP